MTNASNGSSCSNGHVNGSHSSSSTTNGHHPPPHDGDDHHHHHDENPYHLHTTDRIAVIGAGVAGIAMASALQNANYTNFIVYDKQSSMGGLWLQNYPNIAGTTMI